MHTAYTSRLGMVLQRGPLVERSIWTGHYRPITNHLQKSHSGFQQHWRSNCHHRSPSICTSTRVAKITIHTDSRWAINTIAGRWRSKSHHDLIQLAKKLSKLGKTFFQWIKGHSGQEGNERADALADKGKQTKTRRGTTAMIPSLGEQQTRLHNFGKQPNTPLLPKQATAVNPGSQTTLWSYSLKPG